MHPTVAAVQHPVKVGALPQHQTVEPGAKRSRVAADVSEPDAIEPSSFDANRDVPRDSRSLAEIGLAQTAPSPDRAQ